MFETRTTFFLGRGKVPAGYSIRPLLGLLFVLNSSVTALAADPVETGVGYLRRATVKTTLSLVEQPAADDGVAGARLAIDDNNTTGKFLNQHFTLHEMRLKETDDPAKAATQLADQNIPFIVADLPAEALIKAADAIRDRGVV